MEIHRNLRLKCKKTFALEKASKKKKKGKTKGQFYKIRVPNDKKINFIERKSFISTREGRRNALPIGRFIKKLSVAKSYGQSLSFRTKGYAAAVVSRLFGKCASGRSSCGLPPQEKYLLCFLLLILLALLLSFVFQLWGKNLKVSFIRRQKRKKVLSGKVDPFFPSLVHDYPERKSKVKKGYSSINYDSSFVINSRRNKCFFFF